MIAERKIKRAANVLKHADGPNQNATSMKGRVMAASQPTKPAALSHRVAKDLTGLRFGQLLVLSRHPERMGRDVGWDVRCDCGKEFAVRSGNLLRPHGNVSCGCAKAARRTTHGQSRTPAHRSWDHMMGRCYREADDRYRDYGGRGIVVCERWHDFANFFADMGARPIGTTLDRIEVNGNYEPSNCRWATNRQQSRNTRRNQWVEFEGERMVVLDVAVRVGMSPKVLERRLAMGWDLSRAVSEPLHNKPNKQTNQQSKRS